MNEKIVTRFAPSPTGLLHLGTYRTAVFAYLFAKKNNGELVLRIEDTDKERNKKEYEDNIIDSLKWLSISYDRFYRQSENIISHTSHLNRLIEEGKAYVSKEEAKDGSGVMRELIRFKNEGKVVAFDDLIRGRIEIDTTDLGDFVIAKSLNDPLFHLAVVIDDHEEGVTHVIRGEDHIPNTPRQMLIAEALGFPHPVYAHLPLVLAPDRTKLSKRKGALAVTEYRERGYLPETLVNFMALIGWNPGGEQELFSIQELVELFDLSAVHKSGAVFNEEKLNWMNKEYIRKQSPEAQLAMLQPYFSSYNEKLLQKLQPLIIDRITHYGELSTVKDEFSFFKEDPVLNAQQLCAKGVNEEVTRVHLVKIIDLIKDEQLISPEGVKNIIFPYAEAEGRAAVLWPLRVALSGRDKSPDPFTIAFILGKDKTISRLEQAIKLLVY